MIRHNLGLKAPRGWGWLTNPKKVAYNRVYHRTSRGCFTTVLYLFVIPVLLIILVVFVGCTESDSKTRKPVYVGPSVDYKGKFRKGYVRMPVSTKKNAVKKQNSSHYYYQTRGKYRRKSKN